MATSAALACFGLGSAASVRRAARPAAGVSNPSEHVLGQYGHAGRTAYFGA
jgi:hypothetical protein